MWKSVENCLGLAMRAAASRKPLLPVFCGFPGGLAQSLRACSARAGDYEDPDRTVWMPDEEVEELAMEKAQDRTQKKVENDVDANGDEFPAQET